MIWHETVTYNYNDNDSTYNDNDNNAFSNGENNSLTHSPGPATSHRLDSNAGWSNIGPTSGGQYRRRANGGPTPTAV